MASIDNSFMKYLDKQRVGYARIDKNLTYLRINSHLARINGLSIKQHSGKSIKEIVPFLAVFAVKMKELIVRTKKPKTTEVSGYIKGEKKHRFFKQIWIPVLKGNSVQYFDVFVEEITKRKESETELEMAKQTLDALMDNIPEGITIADSKGVIRAVSSYATKMLGISHTDMTTKDVIRKLKVYEKDGKTEMSQDDVPLVKSMKEGKIFRNMELVQDNITGKKLNLLCNAAPIWEKRKDRVIGGIVAWREISELKKSEQKIKESEKKYRTLFQTMTEGFAFHEMVLNDKGEPVDYIFLEINPAFEKLTGLKRKHIIGKKKSEILPGDDPEWVRMYGKVALSGESVHFDNYSPVLKRHYDVYAFSPEYGQFAVLFTDITQRKVIEQRKDDFINIASHELKTPLTSIKAFTQILQKRLRGVDKKTFSMLKRVDEQVNKLVRIWS